MLEETFNTLLEKQRSEVQSTLASTEQFIFNESLTENLKPSPLKSMEQLIKERQVQAHTLLVHFINELRDSIELLRQKSTEEQQQQLRVWVATFWFNLIKQQTDSVTTLSEEEVVAALEGDKLWETLEVLVMLNRQPPSEIDVQESLEQEEISQVEHAGTEVIYAVIQHCINECELKGVSGLYRLSLMFTPLKRNLWMEYAQHAWTFETAEVAESIYLYVLDLFPGDFYVRICLAEFYHATERDAEAQGLVERSLTELKENRLEDTPTYEAFIELGEEIKAKLSVAR